MGQRFYKLFFKISIAFIAMAIILVNQVDAHINPLQIVKGFDPPNEAFYVVLDTSGSLAFPEDTTNLHDVWGIEGGFYYYSWAFSSDGITCTGTTAATIAADYKVYINMKKPNRGAGQGYWLLARTDADYSYWYWIPYSRMAGIKNFFGRSIRKYAPKNPSQLIDPCGKHYYQFPLNGGPRIGAYYDYQSAIWHGWSVGGDEPMPDAAYTDEFEPFAYIERTSYGPAWGLILFHDTTAELKIPINLDDHSNTIQQFNEAMSAVPDGINPTGSTPTNLALNRAKWELFQTYDKDSRGPMRYYASILITDGASNTCNPGDNEWGSGCPGYDDGTTWHNYPTGRSDELFLRLLDQYSSSECKINDAQVQKNMQTFVIGIGSQVSQCELNLIAYFGRTDANRWDYDWGRDWLSNPRSPQNTSGTTTLDNYDPAGGNYAALISTDELFMLDNIFVNQMAWPHRGDFAVSAPALVEETNSSVILNSTRRSGWLGGVRKWIVAGPDQGDGSNHQMAVFESQWCDKVNDSGPDPQHIIYYSGDRSKQHFHLIWDAACSLKLQYDPFSSTHNRNIYTVATACNIASSSGPDSNCKYSESNLIKLEKNSATISWLRNKITSINWALYDFNSNGIPASIDDNDMLMLIDFILGGTGTTAPNSSRFWMLGDIINSAPLVVETSFPYLDPQHKNILSKSSPFCPGCFQPYKIVYVASNEGMLHAFRYSHDPRDPATHSIEIFGFVPPTSFPAIAQLFSNYLHNSDPNTSGQPSYVDFDAHIWSLAASPASSNIWVNWYGKGAGSKRTILFLPLGPKSEGLYALDVTNPLHSNPPFDVIWYWNAKEIQGNGPKEIWSPVSVGLSQAGGKVNDSYQNWIVSFSAIRHEDLQQVEDLVILKADTGELYLNKEFGTPPYEELFPFHLYGNAQTVACNPSDGIVSHIISSSTRGLVPALLVNNDKTVLWDFNNPINPLNYGSTQPLYHQPVTEIVDQNRALLLASITGSIFETDVSMNGASSTFVTKIMLDVLDIDPDTKNLAQHSSSQQHREWAISGDFPVDTNGDGYPDMTKTFSPISRATAKPIIILYSDYEGKAYFPIFDPTDLDPAWGLYLGNTYIASVNFQIAWSIDKTIISAADLEPFIYASRGIMGGFTLLNGKLIPAVSGYGSNSVCMPE